MEKNKAVKFSVLIANYNNGEYLEQTLSSIYAQTYTNWEIIIVDDCSSDISHDIYKKLSDNSQIKVICNNENKGVGYTKRECVKHATGELCAFLDPDDVLSLNALEIMVASHEQYPDCALTHSKLYYCDEQLNIYDEYKVAKQVPHNDPFFFNLEGEITAFAAFKKTAYAKTLGLDSYYKRAIDQDLYFKLYEVGDVIFVDEFLYHYRIHQRGISTYDNSPKALAWKWFAIFDTAKRRNINIESMFMDTFVSKQYFEEMHEQFLNLAKEYNKLYKYKGLNSMLHKIKKVLLFWK